MRRDISFLPRLNGTEHLPRVPGVTEVLEDPRVRAELLLLQWERSAPSSTGPLPHGPSVLFSKKCADSPIGLGLIQALVRAAVLAKTESRPAHP